MKPPVSLCLIARDEEHNLPDCLGPLADLVGEIVVVDTGSSDRTREVAARLGARVFDFPWVDSFAAARNESLRHARLPWVLWLDADDRLDAANRDRLRGMLASLPDDQSAYLMQQQSGPADGTEVGMGVDHVRLFRNHPAIRWDYRVHEQIVPAILRHGGRLRRTDIAIRHVGYQDPALRKRKEERNLRLLRMQDADRPDDSATLFHLGWTLMAVDRHDEALGVLRRTLQRAHPDDSITRKLYPLLARCHRHLNQREEAVEVIARGLRRYPDDPELLFLDGTLRYLTSDLPGAERQLLRLVQGNPAPYVAVAVDPAWRGYKGRYNLGIVYRDQGRPGEAEAQLRAVVQEQPGYLDAWIALTDLWVAAGRMDEVERTLGQLRADPTRAVTSALVQSRLHLADKQFGSARALLEEALGTAPNMVGLRLALSHVLLCEGRDVAATEQALRGVLELDPGNQQARANLDALRRRAGPAPAVEVQATGQPEALPQPPRSPREAEEQFQRAEQAFHADRRGEARAIYQQLLRIRACPGVMLVRLGMLANRDRDYESAWQLHRQAVAADPRLAARVTPPGSAHHELVLAESYEEEATPACPVCGNAEQSPEQVVNLLLGADYHPALPPVRRWCGCARCGHRFANPCPGPAVREALERDRRSHPGEPDFQEFYRAAEVVHGLWGRRRGGDFLEVGGDGLLVGAARDFGFRAAVVNSQPAGAEWLDRLEVERVTEGLAGLVRQGRRYDVISVGETLLGEAEPRRLVALLAGLLAAGGLLHVSVPDHAGSWARRQGDGEAAWLQGRPLHRFCRRSLLHLLEGEGLALVDFRLSQRFPGWIEATVESG
jgi:tetratricopeptide (TPR) repeat protein